MSTYLILLTLCWSVLLTYYLVALRRYYNWTVKRWLLLGLYVGGLLLPLLTLLERTAGGLTGGAASRYLLYAVGENLQKTLAAPAGHPTLTGLLYLGYGGGVLVVLFAKLLQVIRLRRLHRSGELGTYAGHPVLRHRAVGSPFVALGWIYLPAGTQEEVVLRHEAAHLRAGHHWDALFLDLGQVVLWFHPLHYVFRRLLSDVHEFYCDRLVTEVIPRGAYARRLVAHALTGRRYLGISSSLLTTRIAMLSHRYATALAPARRLALLVLVVGLGTLGLALRSPLPAPSQQGFGPLLTGDGTVLKTEEEFVKAFYRYIRYPVASRAAARIGQFRVEVWADGDRNYSRKIDQLPVFEKPEKLTQFVVVGYHPNGDGTVSTECDLPADFVREINHALDQLDLRSVSGGDVIYPFAVQFLLE